VGQQHQQGAEDCNTAAYNSELLLLLFAPFVAPGSKVDVCH